MTLEFLGWDEDVWTFLDRLSILESHLMFLLALLGGFVGFLKREDIRRWFARNHFPNVGPDLDDAENWRAVVFTVSHAELPTWVMESTRPEHIGLVATPESQDAAQRIAAQARKQNIRVHGPLTVENPDDPAESRAQTRLLLARLREAGIAPEDMAVDITGGKTTMSLGAFMAAEEMGVSTLYVASRYDAALRRPDMRSARLHCISKPE